MKNGKNRKNLKAILLTSIFTLASISTFIQPNMVVEASVDKKVMAEEYLNLIQNIENQAGKLYEPYSNYNYEQSSGVVYTDLIDFNGDGIEELYIIKLVPNPNYTDSYSQSDMLKYMAIENIFSFNGSSTKLVFSDEYFCDGDHATVSHYVGRYLYSENGKTYLVHGGDWTRRTSGGIRINVREFNGDEFIQTIEYNNTYLNANTDDYTTFISLNDRDYAYLEGEALEFENKYYNNNNIEYIINIGNYSDMSIISNDIKPVLEYIITTAETVIIEEEAVAEVIENVAEEIIEEVVEIPEVEKNEAELVVSNDSSSFLIYIAIASIILIIFGTALIIHSNKK